MSIEAITAINAASLAGSLAPASAASMASATTSTNSIFSSVLDQISSLDTQMKVNDESIRSMALGDDVSLHEVMMDLERTRLTFDLMLQVRNKFMDAYQELMRMQV
jgi:flagellar hook-basal body complex protein FliE